MNAHFQNKLQLHSKKKEKKHGSTSLRNVLGWLTKLSDPVHHWTNRQTNNQIHTYYSVSSGCLSPTQETVIPSCLLSFPPAHRDMWYLCLRMNLKTFGDLHISSGQHFNLSNTLDECSPCTPSFLSSILCPSLPLSSPSLRVLLAETVQIKARTEQTAGLLTLQEVCTGTRASDSQRRLWWGTTERVAAKHEDEVILLLHIYYNVTLALLYYQ